MEKILIVGVKGMLGNALAEAASKFDVVGTCNTSDGIKLDITKASEVNDLVRKIRPELVVNCAALTNVDFCEANPSVAHEVHVSGTKHLSDACAKIGSKFVHISTDFVFDGLKGNYTESDHTVPVNVYGRTKLEGEKVVARNDLVLRTCIFGKNVAAKKSMVEWIVDELVNGRKISVFSDSFFTPMYTGHLAQIILEAYKKGMKGLFHAASTERVEKFTFAKAVAKIYRLDDSLISPSSIETFSRPARRPKDTSLNCSKIMHHGVKLSNFKDEIGMMRDG